MDRLNQLRGEAGGSGDSTLDTSASPSEAYMTANESSKYFSFTEDDSSFDITPIKDVSLASTVEAEKNITGNDQLISTGSNQLISNLSPIGNKSDMLGGYKLDKQIEAANILLGGVDIFDDNDNSYDGDELVIDDNVVVDDKSNTEYSQSTSSLIENAVLPFQKTEEITESIDNEPAIGSKDTEVVLQIDGINVNAIEISDGLYLYRKAGKVELEALQILSDDHDQPTFKFLKVRDNEKGQIEIYEEISVTKQLPAKDEKSEENTSLVPINDINKTTSEPACTKVVEWKNPQQEIKPIASTSDNDELNKVILLESKPETNLNLNGKMMKYNETRKSPVIHSIPNKEGIPLTKTMVDMQLHPSRPLDKVKTIEVHTDNIKQRIPDMPPKNKDLIDDQQCDVITTIKETEKPVKMLESYAECKEEKKASDPEIVINDSKESDTLEAVKTETIKSLKDKPILTQSDVQGSVTDKQNYETTDEKEEKVPANIKPENPTTEEFKKYADRPTGQITEDLKEKTNKDNNQKVIHKFIEKTRTTFEPSVKIDNSLETLKESKSEQIKNVDLIAQIKPETVKENQLNTEQTPKLKEKQDVKLAADTSAVSDTSKGIEPNSQKVSSKDNLCMDIKNLTSEISNNIITDNFTEKINKTNTTKNSVTPPEVLQRTQSTPNIEIDSKIISKVEENIVLTASTNKPELTIQNREKEIISKPDKKVTKDNPFVENTKSSCKVESLENKESTTLEQKSQNNSDGANDKLNTAEKQSSFNITEKQSSFNKAVVTLKGPVSVGKITENTDKKDSKQQKYIQSDPTKEQTKTSMLPAMVPINPQRKTEISKIPCSTVEKKPIINNNAAVPFGQWTSANRQEFLNKIKEVKVPVNVSNTKSISKPNDLNRRDVLQKIDSQRQSSNAASKTHELGKLGIKNETPTFTNKPATNQPKTVQESKTTLKVEVQKNPVLPKKGERSVSGEKSQKEQLNSTVTTATSFTAKSEGPNRNEFNNQDLIDKTVEGIINRAVSAKHQDPNLNKPKEPVKTQTAFPASYKSRDSKPSFLDAIEMKMNELHGIPFVERPPHELPKVYNRDIKTYGKADNPKLSTNKVSQIPNLLPVSKYQHKIVKDDVIDLDSEEEVIEHEPITGDIDLHKKNITSEQSNTSVETNMAQIGSDGSKKESIITEKDFDKFVRRNSITYENCLTVNIEKNKNRNVVQGLVQKDAADKTTKKDIMSESKKSSNQKTAASNHHSNKMQFTSKLVPVGEDALNKNYHSKLQLAYQTALTTKRQMASPITIIEDKPVKVVFMDNNTNFQACQLNVQGQELSPSKKPLVPIEPDSFTISPTCDSVDSEVLDVVEGIKPQDETKSNKTKHQRKQVLTPVETPELELIVPGDLGIEVSPKKKRRIDEIKTDKNPRNVVPKKSYLLGRNAHMENPAPQDLNKDASTKLIEEQKDMIINHNNTALAIDNLVKAAELIENQSSNFKENTDKPPSDAATPITPAKRGRGRPRKYPLPDGTPDNSKAPSPQKKLRLIDTKEKLQTKQSTSDEDNSDDSSDDVIVRENWTMGKINEKIVCPICNKLFRSENVVFKHVKHCTGPSPNRSDSDKRSSRRSRLSYDSKSIDSKIDDTDGETDSVNSKISTAKKRKSKELSLDGKEEIIVIEDTPVKSKAERSVEPKQHESRKPTKTKAEYKVSTLSCEYCGKSFRQLSYLVSHKLLHKKDNPKSEVHVSGKTVFSCEVCQKEFRKLHHLVQHRFIHNPTNLIKSSRKSSSEQDVENKTSKNKEIKQAEDQSAGFRCEPCDKSFRKLHHLVEHRETHDGINRQKGTPTTQNTEKIIPNPPPPPQCDICKKTFRKLHHLIEHKEQHLETSSEMSDDKSVKSALSTKDIIHECPLCYMVFPNVHSLNKHTVFCKKKKVKQVKPIDETVAERLEMPIEKESTSLDLIKTKSYEVSNLESLKNDALISEKVPDIKTTVDIPETTEKIKENVKENMLELPIALNTSELEKSDSCPVKPIKYPPSELPQELQKTEKTSEIEPKDTVDISKKKTPSKGVPAAKRRKSNLPLARIKESIALENSDDDEVRYMLNPNYKESPQKPDTGESSEGRLFMKVKAKKRNSLQFERPNSKDLMKRRTSLQNLIRVPRMKTKTTDSNASNAYPSQPNISNPAKAESIDSDDSDVKYSFPDVMLEPSNSVKPAKEKRQSIAEKVQIKESEKTPKDNKRKSMADKRKILSGIARRKSLGKTKIDKQIEKASPMKEVKKRRVEVEHRCDCGQLFSSAAMLSRHTSLAHTPPRVRRRRTASPPPAPPSAPATRKPSKKSTDSRKSSVPTDADNSAPKKPGRPPGKTPTRKSIKAEPKTGLQSSRKMAAHRGVPVPEKMRKALEKLK